MEERYVPPEARGGASLWKRIRSLKEAAVFTLLLGTLTPNLAFGAEERPGGSVPEKDRSAEKLGPDVQRIAETLKTKGIAGMMERTPVRKWRAKDGSLVEVGYDASGKPQWLYNESPSAHLRFLDLNLDGLVDRVVLNKSNPPGGTRGKSASNDLNSFSPMTRLGETASTEAELSPEAIKVYEFGSFEGEPVARAVDFETGATPELRGPDAEGLRTRLQRKFAEMVTAHNTEL